MTTTQTNTEKTLKQVVNDYEKTLDITPRIKTLISCARYDLYFGPYETGADIDESGIIYPGFSSALDEIKDALSDVCELWIDTDCRSYSTSEPQGEEVDGEWQEPFLENTYHLEANEVLGYILGKELASYI